MRIYVSLCKASLAAAVVFAIAWIRVPLSRGQLSSVFGIFMGYGFLIFMLALLIGFPLILIIEKYRLGRWWCYATVAATLGAALPAVVVQVTSAESDGRSNPFALVFSPWTRNSPGFVGDIPASILDYAGSIAFGAIVGGTLGIAFWYFYSRMPRQAQGAGRVIQ